MNLTLRARPARTTCPPWSGWKPLYFDYDRLSRRNFSGCLRPPMDGSRGRRQRLGYAWCCSTKAPRWPTSTPRHRPARRSISLGKLLEAAERSRAGQRPAPTLRLEVRPDNPWHIALYERNGYRPFATVRDYYEDHSERCASKRILAPARPPAIAFYPADHRFHLRPVPCLLMAMGALQSRHD